MEPAARKPVVPLHPFGAGSARAEGEESFWTWRRLAADVVDVALHPTEPVEAFQAEVEAHRLGEGAIVRLAATRLILRRSAFTIARASLDHYVIQLCRRGGYLGQAGAEPIALGPGDTAILDLAETLHVQAEALETLNLIVPRAILAPLVRDPQGLHGIVLAAGSPQGEMLGQHLEALLAQVDQISDAETPALLRATAALIAACTSLAAAGRAPNTASPTPSVMRILHAIDRSLADPDLSAETLMRQFGLSRAALYRLFAPYGGVAKHIRAQRLKRCFAEITSPTGGWKRIAAIAGDWGFASEAVFCRSFRETFGMSPREARRAAMAGGAAKPRQLEKKAASC
jgi:AraC-like DNA-binding protein